MSLSLSFWFLSNWHQVFGLIIPEKKENVPKYDKNQKTEKVHEEPKKKVKKAITSRALAQDQL